MNKNGQAREPKAEPALPRQHEVEAIPPASEEGTFRRLLYMYGAVTQIELNGFLLGNSIDSDDRKREIKALWREAAEAFQDIVQKEAGIPDSVSLRPLSGQQANHFINELQNSPAFKESFANYPLSFEEVEIDKIVASQRTVHLDFVEQIKKKSDVGSTEKLLHFCLDTGQDNTPLKVGRTAQNAFTLTSANPSLRFLDAIEHPYKPDLKAGYHPGGQPVQAVTVLLGYGSSTINVFRVGGRIILNNGFHRLYALRSLGLSFAPVVIQHITHPELELPQTIADLARDYLVSAPRPGIMRDFFDTRLNCEVRQRNFLKALQVGWGVNESRVPL